MTYSTSNLEKIVFLLLLFGLAFLFIFDGFSFRESFVDLGCELLCRDVGIVNFQTSITCIERFIEPVKLQKGFCRAI